MTTKNHEESTVTDFSDANPLVSIVLPVHNGERFLAQSINSVIEQSYPSWELIVVNDHSTDDSVAIASSFNTLTCISSDTPGLGAAWNTGIRAARGELIAFQADDDIWLPDMLKTQVDFLMTNPDYAYSTSNSRYFVEPGESPGKGFRTEHLGQDTQLILMEATMIRKSAFDSIGYFNEELTSAQELDWIARANDAKLVHGRVQKLLLRKRVHGSNMTFDPRSIDQNNQNILKLLRDSIKRRKIQN